jgi:hypothetical protein
VLLGRRGNVLGLLAIGPAIRVEASVLLVGVTGYIPRKSVVARRWMGRWRCSAWEWVEDVVRGIELLLGTVAPRPAALGT